MGYFCASEFYFDIPLMLVPAEVDADVATLQPLSGLTGNNVDVAHVVTVSNRLCLWRMSTRWTSYRLLAPALLPKLVLVSMKSQ